MVPFFSDCSGKSGKSGKAVFSTFFTDCPRKTGKSGKVVPVTASLASHGLPQKIPLYRLFRFFPRTLQKNVAFVPRVVAQQRQCLTCTQKLLHLHRPWLGYSYCHAAPSRLPRRSAVHRCQNCPLAPSSSGQISRRRTNRPSAITPVMPTTAPWQVGYKVNPLIIFENLKGK